MDKIDCLYRLAKHKPTRKLGSADLGEMIEDYVKDLDPYSDRAVELACDSWRLSEEKFFPQIGELLPVVRKFSDSLSRPQVSYSGEWKPPSREEFERLPATAKISSCQIMANDCSAKAIQILVKTTGTRNITLMPEEGKVLMDQARYWQDRAHAIRRSLASRSA